VVAGSALAAPALVRILPKCTLRASGAVPAAIAVRGLTAFAFFGAEAFIPLALTSLKGLSTAEAGVSLTVAALAWSSGAWVQAHKGAAWGRRRTGGMGLVLVTTGIAGAAFLLLPGCPAAVGIVAWAVAGAGMGLTYPVSGLTVLEDAPAGYVGAATASLQLADTLGVALGTGLGGVALSVAVAGGASSRLGIAAADVIAITAALVAIAATRGLPTAAPKTHEQTTPSSFVATGPSRRPKGSNGPLLIAERVQPIGEVGSPAPGTAPVEEE
jgi:MFS family permease